MSTALIPVDPAASPQRSVRVLTISASLLPEEITSARQARRSRVWVIIAVVVVAALCAAWVVFATYQKSQAEDQLATATDSVSDLQRAQRGFSETVRVKADTTKLDEQLKSAMGNDLDWAALLNTLRSAGAPSDVTIKGVTGTMTKADAKAPTSALPGISTATSIGSLVITGSAPDKRAVAAYVDALAKQSILTNPFVTSVATAEGGGAEFSLKADITSVALCGRFTTPCKTSGGK